MTDRDRKLLWGKSGNRCAKCHRLLTHRGQSGGGETVIGEEAHIIGERPGAARYQPLPPSERDAYDNMILLCRNDHVLIDRQPEHWTVQKLRALKREHEKTMTARTAEARSDGLHFDIPPLVVLTWVTGGRQLLNIVGPALAYVFDCDELEGQAEHDAAKYLLDAAHGWGEVYSSMFSPSEQIDAAQNLSEELQEAMRADLILMGARIDVEVMNAGTRERWPVAILRLRRAADVAREKAAARDAEQALREGGAGGLG